jgi:hypothetical protein
VGLEKVKKVPLSYDIRLRHLLNNGADLNSVKDYWDIRVWRPHKFIHTNSLSELKIYEDAHQINNMAKV